MRTRPNLIGKRFGKLEITGVAGPRWVGTVKHPQLHALCDCGKIVLVNQYSVTSGNTKSCGCAKGFRLHLESYSSEYAVWKGMKRRCNSPTTVGYQRYGGRGIKMHQEWQDSFESFLACMGRRPSPKHTIDRIDNNGNYEPDNCRWATRKEQSRNLRTNRMVRVNGRLITLAEAAEISGLKYNTLVARLRRGSTIEQATAK